MDPSRGLALLPKPDPGDLFYDIEGDPFYEGGLEYLFGVLTIANDGELVYEPTWAMKPAEEKRAFQEFIKMTVFDESHIG